MIVFFSLFGSNVSSCYPDLAARTKASCQGLGMASRQGGLGQGTLEGSDLQSQREFSTAAFPCHPSPTLPGLVQDPPVPLSCPAGAWISRYRRQLASSISAQFLQDIIAHLCRLELPRAQEAAQVQAASPLPEQVRAVLDVLAGKGSQASQCLQSFIEASNSQLYLHIPVRGWAAQ